MALCKKYNLVSEAAYDTMNKVNSKILKQKSLKEIDNQLDKLDLIFQKQERYMQYFRWFENHLSAVAACQDVAHIMRDQLAKQIEEMES